MPLSGECRRARLPAHTRLRWYQCGDLCASGIDFGRGGHPPPANERSQPINVKKVLLVLVVVFLGFWMFTDPNGLAVAAGDGADKTWDLAQSLFRAIIDFVDAL